MRIFSDFSLFERAPKPGFALIRWIAWRWCLLGTLMIVFLGIFSAMHYLGGEPIHYTNEDRNLTESEVANLLAMFFSGSGLFFVLGLAGITFVPKA